MAKVTIEFICNTKRAKNPEKYQIEFSRQVKMQSAGLNKLSIQEYLTNRAAYKHHGRSKDGNEAQQRVRERALDKKIAELSKMMPLEKAAVEANKWLKTQAALHNPDQIAGGNPKDVTEMGDKRVNSSLGSQWRWGRAKQLHSEMDKAISSVLKQIGLSDKQIKGILEGDFKNCSEEVQSYLHKSRLNIELRAQGIDDNTGATNTKNEEEGSQQREISQPRAPPELAEESKSNPTNAGNSDSSVEDMDISTEELIAKVVGLKKTASDLSNKLTAANTNLEKSVGVISSLTKGSASGIETTTAIKSAMDGVNTATQSLSLLGNLCEEFIQNAQQ